MFSIHSILESAREISIQHFGQFCLVVDMFWYIFVKLLDFYRVFYIVAEEMQDHLILATALQREDKCRIVICPSAFFFFFFF